MERVDFDAKTVLELLIQRSQADKVLATQIEAAVWQSKFLQEVERVKEEPE